MERGSRSKWYLPDAIEFVDEIPRTPAGKFLRLALRDRYGDYALPTGEEDRLRRIPASVTPSGPPLYVP